MRTYLDNPARLRRLDSYLVEHGIVEREDASTVGGETLVLARELEFVSATSYDVFVDPKKGRLLVPFNWSIPEGADTYSYDMFDGFARAEWVTNWASIVGQADAKKTRTIYSARSFASSYSYTHQDLANAAFSRQPLDKQRAKFCRIGHEQFIDDLIAVGDSERGIAGLTNHANIPLVVPRVGGWVTNAGSITNESIFKDLDHLCQAVEQQSAQNFYADTLVLPLSQKELLTRPYSIYNPKSLISVWLEKQSESASRLGGNAIKNLEFWKRLDTADAGGTGPRALAYKKDPMVLEFLGSYDFREFNAQQVALAFQVPTLARVIGLCLRYPLATAKMDLNSTP
jgi:hypothetical protein